MLRLLIAEDEKNSREGLVQCIDWTGFGIELLAAARNGKEALEIAEKEKPDIVISDIRMPKMDGVRLAQLLREKYEDVKIIFISGYSDTEYLKSAIRYGATDYLFKPVDIEELKRVVIKTIGEIRDRNEERIDREMAERRLRKSMPQLQEKFFRSLLDGGTREDEEIRKQLVFLNIHMPLSGKYAVLLIHINEGSPYFDMELQHDIELMRFVILNIVGEILDRGSDGYVFEYDRDVFACILVLPEDNTLSELCVERISNDIHDSLNRSMQIGNTIGVGRWVEGIGNIRHSFRYAKDALAREVVLGKNIVIYIDSNAEETGDIFMVPQNLFTQLSSAVLNGDSAGSSEALDKLISFLKGEKGRETLFYRNACLMIASCLVSTASRVEIREPEVKHALVLVHQEMMSAETLDEIREVLGRCAEALCRSVRDAQVTKNSALISEIRLIIAEEYGTDLSISKIAKKVYLSPTYICLLFKQETGKTINACLTDTRIDKAKELLAEGNYRVMDVASMVGYHDVKYFCRLFKAKVGVNPSEYRQVP